MDGQATGGLLRHFQDLPDPRAPNVVHRLTDVLAIAICAVICGAESWVDVEMFGNSKLTWLRTFLTLPGGIPSHDTFGRLFARLDPTQLEARFVRWTQSLKDQQIKHLAIDGKTIRRSFQHAWDQSGMAHLVSVYAVEQRLVLGQINGGAGNELQTMRELIDLLTLDEATVVTIDAAACQRDVAQKLIDKDADYVLAVKQNQPTLHQKLSRVMDELILEKFKGVLHGYVESTDGEHDRIETRRVWVCDQVQHLGEQLLAGWPSLSSMIAVERTWESGGRTTTHRRYFISSLDGCDAQRMSGLIRGHWSIENNLHWQLDVSFGEDLRRVRKDHSSENFSRLCRITLNLLQADKSIKVGIKAKRKRAGWDEPYLLKILTG